MELGDEPSQQPAGEAAAPGGGDGQRRCSHCRRTAQRWSRHPDTHQLLCSSCCCYRQNHGHLPDESWVQQRQQLAAEEKRCSHCGAGRADAHSSRGWLRHPQSRKRLCAHCWQHSNRTGGQLPDLEARRRRQQQRREEKRCTHCGDSESSGWYRHPATKQRLCNSCGLHHRKHGQLPTQAWLRRRQERRQKQPQGAGQRRGGRQQQQRQQQRQGEGEADTEEEEEEEERRQGGGQRQRRAKLQQEDWEPGREAEEGEEETESEPEAAAEEEEEEELEEDPRRQGRQKRQPRRQQSGQRRRRGEAEQRCSHCGAGSDISGTWRRMPGTLQRICTPCWAYQTAGGRQLPPVEWVVKSLQRRRQKQLEAQQGERRCGHCGAGGPSDWARHKATQLLLCTSCSLFARKHGGQLPDLEEKRRKAEEPLVCTHCGTSNSIAWRRQVAGPLGCVLAVGGAGCTVHANWATGGLTAVRHCMPFAVC